jgi:hypothetical protein
MDNRCFIVLPTSEPAGYSQGHFGRVHDYIVVPACRVAGYWPTRADSITHENRLDILKDIIESEIVLCDLSANDPTSLYVLAVRHALQLPVTLIKDLKTFPTFDTSGFSTVEYDDSLRIDTVQKATEAVGNALKETVEKKSGRHELLNRLGIGLPPVIVTPSVMVAEFTSTTSNEDSQNTSEPEQKSKLPVISPVPDYVGEFLDEAQLEKVKGGDILFHINHGRGTVNFVKKMGKDKVANIQFESGTKLLVLGITGIFRKVNS